MVNLEDIRPPREEVEKPTPTRVLVVEDDKSLLGIMKGVLGTLDNVNVSFCTAGAEAIALLGKSDKDGEGFSRIITDFGLEGKETGFDVAAAAKKLPTPPFVILFTSSAEKINDENTPEQLREMGIGLVAAKPLNVKQIKGLANEPISQLSQLLNPQL